VNSKGMRAFITLGLGLLFIFNFNAIAQEVESPFEYTQKIQKQLSELKDLGPDNFLIKVELYRDNLEQYFEHKKRVCNGEFSTVILSEAGERTEGGRRLSKDELKLCFREMKALQTTYINNMHAARKRYIESLHSDRIQQLEESREKALNDLNATFSRILK